MPVYVPGNEIVVLCLIAPQRFDDLLAPGIKQRAVGYVEELLDIGVGIELSQRFRRLRGKVLRGYVDVVCLLAFR